MSATGPGVESLAGASEMFRNAWLPRCPLCESRMEHRSNEPGAERWACQAHGVWRLSREEPDENGLDLLFRREAP